MLKYPRSFENSAGLLQEISSSPPDAGSDIQDVSTCLERQECLTSFSSHKTKTTVSDLADSPLLWQNQQLGFLTSLF